MSPFCKGTNPRDVPELHHRERGSRKWRYGYDEIAAASGMKRSTVMSYASRGHFDPDDLLSVAQFIMRRRGLGAAPSPSTPVGRDGVLCGSISQKC